MMNFCVLHPTSVSHLHVLPYAVFSNVRLHSYNLFLMDLLQWILPIRCSLAYKPPKYIENNMIYKAFAVTQLNASTGRKQMKDN